MGAGSDPMRCDPGRLCSVCHCVLHLPSEQEGLYLPEHGYGRLPGHVQADFACQCLLQWARPQAGANTCLCAQLCASTCVCVYVRVCGEVVLGGLDGAGAEVEECGR